MFYLSTILQGDFVTVPVNDGIKILCPVNSPIYAACDGIVYGIAFNGSTSHLIIKHEDSFTHYSEIASLVVKSGDVIEKGQLIGYSGNGVIFQLQSSEGMGDFIDPFGDLVIWEQRKESEKPKVLKEITLSLDEHARLSAMAENYRKIALEISQIADFKAFLAKRKRIPLDLKAAPYDQTGGESINLYITDLLRYILTLKREYIFYPKNQKIQTQKSERKSFKDKLSKFIWVEKPL